MNLHPIYTHIWLALYIGRVDGLLRYRDGSLHPYQPRVYA